MCMYMCVSMYLVDVRMCWNVDTLMIGCPCFARGVCFYVCAVSPSPSLSRSL